MNDDITALLKSIPLDLFLEGQFVPATSGQRFEVLNPATGEVIASVADAGEPDGARALDAAAAAQRDWAATAPRVRGEILRRAFELMDGPWRRTLAQVMTLEMGKPLAQADGEVSYGAEFLRWFSEEAARIRGDYFRVPEGHLQAIALRRPVGPCLLITPWNFPLAMATRKAGPAFAAGCTAILKPAAQTPLTALLFAHIMREAGLPDGVLAVLPTSRAGALTSPLLRDARLRKLSFTGSTVVGRALLRESAENVLRTSMELGGKAPFIVFDDADIELAVTSALATKMRNMGQACNAADYFFVHEKVFDEFVEKFSAAIAAQRVGDGMQDGVDVGPLISASQRAQLAALVDGAVRQGARVTTGGKALAGSGFFYAPTVLTDVPLHADIMREEIFGPVAPVVRFDDEAELVRIINAGYAGLSAYLHTRDMGRIMRLAEQLEIGMIGVNTGTISNAAAPFGGMKHSGLGREGGKEGIDEYLETVYVGLPAPRL